MKLESNKHFFAHFCSLHTYCEKGDDLMIKKITIILVAFAMILSVIPAIGNSTVNAKSNIEKQTWNYFRKAGCSKQATAAIMGNIKQESGFNASCKRCGEYGLYMLPNNYFSALKAYAKKQNKSWKNATIQNKYLNTKKAPNDFKLYTGKTYKFSNGTIVWWPKKMTWGQFKKLKNVTTATKIFERVCLRCGDPRMKTRIKSAQQYYKKFK